MRSQYKSEEYFKKYISEQKTRIKSFENFLNNLDDLNSRNYCRKVISDLYKDLFLAEYSLGMDRKEIRKEVLNYLKYAENTEISNYNDMADILSLIIIFDVSPENAEYFLNIKDFDDSFICVLKSCILNVNFSSNELFYPENYKIFLDYANSSISKDKLVSYMKSEWYESCKTFYFYDAHTKDSDVYTGYWCLPATALLKVTGDVIEFDPFCYIASDLI